jgi:hypothetical protein
MYEVSRLIHMANRSESTVVSLYSTDKGDIFSLFNSYFTSVVQQPYGYNLIGQLQEPKELIWPATAKIVSTIL